MSDEEDLDIANTLAGLEASASDASDSESDYEGDVQDVISDDEQPAAKKQKTTGFPKLELSDDEDDDAASRDMALYFATNNPNAKKAKAGSFQLFGLSRFILTNISKKGYRQPTPIQRKTIPLVMEGRDVVGMARTGSGKTAAFTLPVVEKLKAHSAKVGVRAVILSPSRELALQTFKQVKEFLRGTDLRSVVLIGGDSLEEQFASMMENPDVVVATPGRFLHLKVEMDLDLKTVEYIVFDEADRLFEMGFSEQLNELLAALPSLRQSLLFSATLPRTLVDFAKAGLTNPVLVRLDAESKLSDELQMAFFTTTRGEREANLLYVLQEVIKLPFPTAEEKKKMEDIEKRQMESDEEDDDNDKKKKRYKFKKERLPPANVLPSPHSTIVFVPTKHHVEYVTSLLRDAGYLVSYIYGSLDQHARKQQLYQFRAGLTSMLVVTDVAARGIDIPVLANVVNYTLPASSKIFVHRVGRTARAGNKGWAYAIVNEKELPYLLDLELFLGRKVLLTSMHEQKKELLRASQGDAYEEPKISYIDRLVVGAVPRLDLETFQELYENLARNHYDLTVLRDVAAKGEKLYHRTRQPASAESIKRSKEILLTGSFLDQHLIFGADAENEKTRFLERLQNRKSKETVFEFSKKGREKAEDSIVTFMQKRRRQIAPIQRRALKKRALLEEERRAGLAHGIENEILKADGEVGYSAATADEEVLQDAFEDADALPKKRSFRDPAFFMSHYAPTNVVQDQQLSLLNSFANDAANATFDLGTDDKLQTNSQVMKWDRKGGKYVNSQLTDKKYIIGESGQRIPATYRSGKYDEWRKQRGVQPVKVGATEKEGQDNKRYTHKKVSAPKLPDKFRDDYHKQKKKVEKALEAGRNVKGYHKPGQKLELKSTEDIRKARALKEKRREKNARPSKRKR